MILRLIARIMPESYLLANGIWCEDSGAPWNVWAQEFDRRDYGWPKMNFGRASEKGQP